MKKSKTTTPPALTESEVKEVVSQLLTSAFQTHSRQMEEHLQDIDSRLQKLEGKR
jgi:hypothetical protein